MADDNFLDDEENEDLVVTADPYSDEPTDEEIAEEMEEDVAEARRDRNRSIFWKLYHGETSFRFNKYKKRWFAISGAIIVAGVIALVFSGLNFGLDFEGGRSWQVPAGKLTEKEVRDAINPLGLTNAKVQFTTSHNTTTNSTGRFVTIQAKSSGAETNKVTDSLAKLGKVSVASIDVRSVSSSWGSQITQKAVRALIAFFILITIYISWRFEPKMAVATFVALLHDILITVGVYALLRYEVGPPTVIAVLTIQGYSIYDTIVVFDKINENTRGLAASGRMSYSDMVDLSLNQVLMRSINTSLTALMPIASLLIIGSFVLGVTALQEFALALFIGLLAGAYSSIFIASPVLSFLKEREPRYANMRARMAGRQTLLTPAAAAAAGVTTGGVVKTKSSSNKAAKPAKAKGKGAPRPRKKGKRR